MAPWPWRSHRTADLLAYDEGSLGAEGARQVERHLERCSSCRADLTSLRSARTVLSRELKTRAMSEEHAARVRAALVRGSTTESSDRLLIPRWAIAPVILIVLIGVGWQMGRPWISIRESSGPGTAIERAAREVHAEMLVGRASVEFASSSAAEIRRWLRERGAARADLAMHPANGDVGLVPVGAGIVVVEEKPVSVVRYQIDGHPVTLLAGNDESIGAPRSLPLSKQVTHIVDRSTGALAWTTGGQAYALVSDLPGGGLKACLMCHADDRFRRGIEKIRF